MGGSRSLATRLCLIAVAVLLSACQLSLPGRVPDAAPANPITTGQISVTSLDQPASPAAGPATGPSEVSAKVVDPAPAVVSAAESISEPAAAPAPPPPHRSAAQIACEKGRGNWVTAGKTGTMSCQVPLRDGGRQCTRDRDCDGQCLARSRTCAPYAPLFGCNEVLQDNGQRVTLCID